MSDRRRLVLIISSVSVGMLFSFLLFKGKKGTLTDYDYLTLGSILVIALVLLIGISFIIKNAKF